MLNEVKCKHVKSPHEWKKKIKLSLGLDFVFLFFFFINIVIIMNFVENDFRFNNWVWTLHKKCFRWMPCHQEILRSKAIWTEIHAITSKISFIGKLKYRSDVYRFLLTLYSFVLVILINKHKSMIWWKSLPHANVS